MLRTLLILFILAGCSTEKKSQSTAAPSSKEFARGEVILATQMLTRIFDGEMGFLECVPDHDEASLLLRTIRPRMEVVEDDIEALLDQEAEVKKLVENCEQSCTCSYVDDLLREHLVSLPRNLRKSLTKKNSEKETNRCMSFGQSTFCQSELYRALAAEKADFSFEEGAL